MSASPSDRVGSHASGTCPVCGTILVDRLGNQCPRCLLGLGDPSGPVEDPECDGPDRRMRAFGDYELIEEIARGGMGVVYRARQVGLGREVAVKMILSGELAGPDSLRMFHREARAAARLSHPNIVPVFEVGEHEFQHYFTMRLVPGGRTIADWARTRTGDWRGLADAMARVARAVAHAHGHGVLHRDLKPSNILWDDQAGPQVTDFGLATLVHEADGSRGATGRLMGSPHYMAPEQVDGRLGAITTTTDVYGLGAVLYELLTQRPPFAGSTPMEVMRRVVETSPGTLEEVPKELRTVCLKCLSKDPADRYATAADLAADLERFVRGEPVSAVPLTALQAVWRWAQRRPQIALLAAATAVALGAGVIGILWQWHRAEVARDGEREARARITDTLVDLYTHSGINAARRGDPTRAALWFAKAAEASPDPARRAEELVRHLAWRSDSPTVVRAFPSGIGPVGRIDWSPDQSAVVLRSRHDGRCAVWLLDEERRWDAPSGARLDFATWAHHTPRIAYITGSRVEIRMFPSGRLVADLPLDQPARHLEFSPDDHQVILCGSPARIWNPATGKVRPLEALPEEVVHAQFSRSGRFLLLTGPRHHALCNTADLSAPLWEPIPSLGPGTATFLGDGDQITAVTPDATVVVLDPVTGRRLETHPTAPDLRQSAVQVSPDGRFIARQNDVVIRRGHGPAGFPRHRNVHEAVAFSSDGEWLATGSFDATLRLWHLPDGSGGDALGWHQHGVTAVAFAPDDQHVASAQWEGDLVRIWRLASGVPHRRIPADGTTGVRLSRDGTLLALSGWSLRPDGIARTRVHSTSDGSPAGPHILPGGTIMDAGFAPDGAWLALVCLPGESAPADGDPPAPTQGGTLQFWDYRRGTRLGMPVELPAEPRGLAVHPDGMSVGVYDARGGLYEVPVETRRLRLLARPKDPPPESNFAACAFSPDGSLLAGWGLGLHAVLWDRAADRRRIPPTAPATRVMDVTFHGNQLALVPIESRIDFLTVPGLTPASDSIQDADWLFVGRFSPDGNLFVSAGRSGLARVWDWRRGTLLSPALSHGDEVFSAAFLPGRDHLATGALDHRIHFWNPRTGHPTRPPIRDDCKVMQLTATADGRTLIRASFETDHVRMYDMGTLFPEPDLPVHDALLLAEIDASAEILQGGVEPLAAADWLERWRRFRAAHPDWHPGPSPVRPAGGGIR